MKKTVCFLIIMFCAVQLLFAQKTTFSDSFNDNHNKWGIYNNKKASYIIYNGKYIMDIADSLIYDSGIPVTIDTSKNFSISAIAMHSDGSDTYGFGLYFGASDISNYYVFVITANGYFRLCKSTPAAYKCLIDWTASPAIKTGSYIENKLQIMKNGSDWKLMINDQLVSTIPSMPFMGNQIGFNTTATQRVEFDDLTVTQ